MESWDDLEEVKKSILTKWNDVTEDGEIRHYHDRRISQIVFIETKNSQSVEIEKTLTEQYNAQQKAKRESKEYEEYQRLKSKFGGS